MTEPWLCASQAGFMGGDCDKAVTDYDNASDAEKAKTDKIVDCIDGAGTCAAAIACSTTSTTS